MSDIIIKGISAIVQLIMTMYVVFTLSEILENKKYELKYKIIFTCIFSISSILSTYLIFPNQKKVIKYIGK